MRVETAAAIAATTPLPKEFVSVLYLIIKKKAVDNLLEVVEQKSSKA